MTKLRACDISQGVSRVEQDTVCAFVRACACGALQGACTYPNGPRPDLIRSGSKKILQLQSRIASLDDPAQGTGGEKYGFERKVRTVLEYLLPLMAMSSLLQQAPFIPI